VCYGLQRTGSKSEQETDGSSQKRIYSGRGELGYQEVRKTIQGPGEEEGGSVSGCVIRGERGSRVQAIPCRARKGEWVSCPYDPV